MPLRPDDEDVIAEGEARFAGKAGEIRGVLNQLINSMPGLRAAVLVSSQGLAMVSTLDTGDEEATISAAVPVLVDQVRAVLEDLKFGHMVSLVLAGKYGYIVARDVLGIMIFAVLAQPGLDWVRFQSRVNWAISELESLSR